MVDGRMRRPIDPTGMFIPGAIPRTPAEWRRKRIAINVSFLWLLIPISDLLSSHPPAWRVAITAVGVVAFIVTYNWLPRARPLAASPRAVWLRLGILLAITIALTVADRESWALLFIFTGISGAMPLAHPWSVLWLAVCTVLCAITTIAVGADAGTTISLTATTAAIGVMMLAFSRLIDLNADLVAAREEVARLAVSEERLRFARDLHDLLGHSLSVIAVKAELAERLLPGDVESAAQHVTELKFVARSALGEVREAVSGYRQPTLVSELAGARMALDAAGIEVELESVNAPLPADVEAVLAWAIREGTTNTIRHSGAHRCRIVVAPEPTLARAEVIDDGAPTVPTRPATGWPDCVNASSWWPGASRPARSPAAAFASRSACR